jgi:hypothetical protein
MFKLCASEVLQPTYIASHLKRLKERNTLFRDCKKHKTNVCKYMHILRLHREFLISILNVSKMEKIFQEKA